MKAFLFSPSNQFKDKINVASKTNLPEELKIFLTHEKAKPYDYIECDGKTWTILSGDDGLELAEGKIPRNSSAPAISSESEKSEVENEPEIDTLASVKEFLANSDQRKELIEDKLNDLKGLFKKEEHPNERIEDKLDKIYDVMNHIRWMLAVACFAIIVVPWIIASLL